MKRALVAVVLFVSICNVNSHAQWSKIAERLGIGNRNTLSDSKITSGLKEALRVGTDNAVKSTGRPNGFFGNAAIKILMPERMQKLEKGLRAVGYGPQVDDFVMSMNRAAEKATPAAKQIFIDAVMQMTFDDARAILSGNDTAATTYFRSKTNQQLAKAFRPIVEQATNEVGATQKYKQLVARTRGIPFVKADSFDLDDYVVSKSLDGLFYVLAQEERNIRQNPQARVTAILKEVFGNTAARAAGTGAN